MDGNPPPDGRATVERQPATPANGAHDAPRVETFGPLAVRRMAKGDGRRLIAYERVDRPAQGGSGEPGRRGARA